jgi:hypothetical protein
MKRIILLALLCSPVFAQTPDCLPPAFNIQTNGDGPYTQGYFDNRTIQCETWTVAYVSDGNVAGFALVFQSATGTNLPGAFVTYTGSTIASSSSFGTASVGIATYSNLSATSGMSVNTPWVRVDVSGGTGVGNIRIQLYGYRTGPTGGTGGGGGGSGTGCPNPCPVTQSTSPWVVQQVGLGTFTSGITAVTATAGNLGTATAKNVCVHALVANTINVYAGASGVTDATGMEIAPGQGYCWQVSNTNLIYVIASTTGASVSWTLTN